MHATAIITNTITMQKNIVQKITIIAKIKGGTLANITNH